MAPHDLGGTRALGSPTIPRPAAFATLLFVASCGDPVDPRLPPTGTFTLESGAPAVVAPSATEWHPVPWTYDVFRDGACVLTLERGRLDLAGGSYELGLSYASGCDGLVPPAIEESGAVRVAEPGGFLTFAPVGDVCGSWLVRVELRGDGLDASVAHPCFGGTVNYLRFVR